MIATSRVMKTWREQKRTQVRMAVEPLPQQLVDAANILGSQFWDAAMSVAMQNMETLKAGMEAERSDIIAISDEQANAFELQTAENARLGEIIAEQSRTMIIQEGVIRDAKAEQHETKTELRISDALLEEARAIAIQLRIEVSDERAKAAEARDQRAHLEGQIEALQRQSGWPPLYINEKDL